MAVITYRPEIDGLRAVAILGVLAFHINSHWIPGGFAGVDVFFVISGYLITSIIFEESKQGMFSFRRFYLRRLKRLFPAMAGVLIAVLAIGAILDPLNYALIRRSAVWILLLSGNFHIWIATGDYWAAGADQNPLLHIWSLAVEEQFYLVFPLTLVILYKWRRHYLFRILAVLTVLSFLGCAIETPIKPAASFYLLPTRAWELAIGCLLAIYPPAVAGQLATHRRAGIFAGGGLIMIGISYFSLQGGHGFPGYQAALPTIGALLIIAFTRGEGGVVAGILRSRWLVLIGKSSYSLYLWHWPVIVFLKETQDNPRFPDLLPPEAVGMASVILSFALAFASYLWVERPLRAWRGTPALCVAVLAGMFAALGLAKPATEPSKHGGPELTEGFTPMTVRGRLYSVNQKNELTATIREKYKNVRFVLPEKAPNLREGVVRNYGAGALADPIDVMVMGDSHSMMYAPLVDDILRELKLKGRFFCADAMDPDLFRTEFHGNQYFGTDDDCRTYDNARRRILDSRPPKLVLWIQRYDEHQFKDVEKSIRYIVRRSKCVFVQQAPVLNIGNLCAVEEFGYFRNVAGIPLDQLRIVEKRQIRIQRHRFEDELLSAFRGIERFEWFETNEELLTSDVRIRWWDGVSKLYYIDDNHLSEYGVQLFRERLERLIVKELALNPSKM